MEDGSRKDYPLSKIFRPHPYTHPPEPQEAHVESPTIVSTSTSHFETSPVTGEVRRVEFRCVPFSDQPYEVTTTQARNGCEVSRTAVGFTEYFSAKASYRHAIERLMESEGVR